MALRGRTKSEPHELLDHEASTLLPTTDSGGAAPASSAVSVSLSSVFSVSSRVRLIAALVLVLVIAVRGLLLAQHPTAEDRFKTESTTHNEPHAILEKTLTQYGDTDDSAVATLSSSPEQPLVSTEEDISETVAPVETVADAREKCYNERDFGLIAQASMPTHVFCAHANGSSTTRTKVTLIDAPSGIRAVVYSDLLVDMAAAKPHRGIASLAQDGGGHDPRYRFRRKMIYCACDELYRVYAKRSRANSAKRHPLWGEALAFASPRDKRDASLVCGGTNVVRPSKSNGGFMEFPGRVLLIARRDDHNPFFQVSNALNAWIMLRALQWDPKNVTLIHFDAGFPSPIDALHEKLLSPQSQILRGRELKGRRLLFKGEVMLVPFETSGPMMQHLDDTEPCFASNLFRTFRDEALQVMEAREPPARADSERRKEIIVTLISRRPYKGRKVQRRWINEDEVVQRLQAEYTAFQGASIIFQSIDFVDLSLQTQMQLMVESDVVVSMHGAGLVNVLWTRPGTLVLEIFPKQRRRWGYRNLCQFVGCDWHEFRGGIDVPIGSDSSDANANDKMIPYDEWCAFFDPLFQRQLAKISGKAANSVPDTPQATQNQETLPTLR